MALTKERLLALVATVVSTLAETDGAPETSIYLLCNSNMDDYQLLRDMLYKADYIYIKGNFVKLTSNGKLAAEKINRWLASRNQQSA